jgi:hypothetical protein
MNSSLHTEISFLKRRQKKVKHDVLTTKKYNKKLEDKIQDTWNWIHFDRKRPRDRNLSFGERREMEKMILQMDEDNKNAQFNRTYIQMNQDFKLIREKIYGANKTLAEHNITWGKNAIYK